MAPRESGDTDHSEERFFELLSRYDDQLVEGYSVESSEGEASPDLRPRLDRARLLLEQLDKIGRAPPLANSRVDPSTRKSGRPCEESVTLDTAGASGDGMPRSARLPERIGRFRIQEEIGLGGFGIVFRAFDPNLQRDVALKIPRLGALATDELRERFVREAWAGAALDHPNIVSVYEAGEIDFVCFIASAYCRGPDLAEWLRQRDEPASPRLAAWIVSVLAQAVEHAHRRGVLHRDLKPSNVLLESMKKGTGTICRNGRQGAAHKWGLSPFSSEFADFPFVPRITDFGLAKLMQPGLAETRSAMVLGSFNYMSPEQASGQSNVVGPHSDVYSLGAILYELLIGRPPLDAENDLKTLQRLQIDDPTPPRKLRPGIPRDLETICLTCLQREPLQRYSTAGGLSDDLLRFLRGEAVYARPTTAPVRTWRWCKRHPLAATLVVLLILLATGGPLVAMNQAWLYREQARLYGEAESARQETSRLLYISDMNSAFQAWEEGNLGRMHNLLERHRPAAGQKDQRNFEWYYLWRRYEQSETPTIQKGLPVYCVGVSPDGGVLAVGGADHLVNLYDADTYSKLGELSGHDAQVISLAFSPDGTILATASWDRTIQLWDVASRQELPGLKRDPLGVWYVVFSADGETLAAANYDGSVTLWDVSTREARINYPDHHLGEVFCVALSHDGRTLLSSGQDGVVKRLDLEGGTADPSRHRDVLSMTYSPGGKIFAQASEQSIELSDASGAKLKTFHGHRGTVTSIAFSRDGKRLASSSLDSTVRLWNTTDGQELTELKGHVGSVQAVTFSANGRRLFSGGLDGDVKAWNVGTDDVQDVLRHPGRVYSVAFSPDGNVLATVCIDGQIRLWDTRTGRCRHAFSSQGTVVARFFSDGRQTMLASAGSDGTVKLWDLVSRRMLRTLPSYRPDTKVLAVAQMSPTLAWLRPNDILTVWSFRSGTELASFSRDFVHSLVLSPDGQLLAAGCSDRIIRVWDVADQTLLAQITEHKTLVHCLSFSPDGTLLATGGKGRTLKLWDVESLCQTGKANSLRMFTGHGGTVRNAAFSPDGKLIASCSADHTVRLWDLRTGEQRGTLKSQGVVVDLAFAPDGKTLASASWDGTARLWRAPQDDSPPRER